MNVFFCFMFWNGNDFTVLDEECFCSKKLILNCNFREIRDEYRIPGTVPGSVLVPIT